MLDKMSQELRNSTVHIDLDESLSFYYLFWLQEIVQIQEATESQAPSPENEGGTPSPPSSTVCFLIIAMRTRACMHIHVYAHAMGVDTICNVGGGLSHN